MNQTPMHEDPSQSRDAEGKFISYQTNKIPWYIHLLWASFAVGGIIYLLRFALEDFLRWW